MRHFLHQHEQKCKDTRRPICARQSSFSWGQADNQRQTSGSWVAQSQIAKHKKRTILLTCCHQQSTRHAKASERHAYTGFKRYVVHERQKMGFRIDLVRCYMRVSLMSVQSVFAIQKKRKLLLSSLWAVHYAHERIRMTNISVHAPFQAFLSIYTPLTLAIPSLFTPNPHWHALHLIKATGKVCGHDRKACCCEHSLEIKQVQLNRKLHCDWQNKT